MAVPEAGLALTAHMVQARVTADFAPGARPQVLSDLEALTGKHRLQLAVLRLAAGDPSRVPALTKEAATGDYRDILAAAEYPRSFGLRGNRPPYVVPEDEIRRLQQLEQDEYLAWLKACE